MKGLNVLIEERVHHYYWNKDLNCATTALCVLAEIFEIDLCSQVIDSAIGMHGGGKFGAQCGLVEGPLMFIGIFGKEQGIDDKDIVNYCYCFLKEFQIKFGSIVCKDLRPQGFKPKNPPHLCEELTKRAIEFIVNYLIELKEQHTKCLGE
jgi:C_GCAxxG_C_C family probable redox protein